MDRPGTGRSHAAWRSTLFAGLLSLVVLLAVVAAPRDASAAELARWPLDEGAGQLAGDVSGGAHHARLGSLAAADSNDPAWVSGRFGGALRFDGERNQFAELAGAAGLAPRLITVDAWIRRLGTPGGSRYVVSSGRQGCDFASFGLYSGEGGGLAFYVSDDGGYVVSPSAPPRQVWDGSWHYAAGTYDGATVRLYLDGAEIGRGTSAGFSIFYGGGDPGAFLGSYRGSCDLPFTGDIDEISVRDTALRPAEVAALAQSAAARPRPPQAPPVSGPPASGRGAAPPRPRCFSLRVRPGRLVAGRRTRLRVAVRRRGRAARGVRVTVRGPGVRTSARTGRAGRASVVVRLRRRGRLRLRVRGQSRRCEARRLKVLGHPGG